MKGTEEQLLAVKRLQHNGDFKIYLEMLDADRIYLTQRAVYADEKQLMVQGMARQAWEHRKAIDLAFKQK